MKQLVNVLYQELLNQIKPLQSNIVRIEGIDNPLIYQNICEKLDSSGVIDEFVPKITREKYIAFEEAGKSEWSQALSYLHRGRNEFYTTSITDRYSEASFVDFNNAITKWRNESANQDVQKTT